MRITPSTATPPTGVAEKRSPVAASTTASGTIRSPTADTGSNPPAIPDTMTRSTSVVASRSSVAASASAGPMPVLVATTSVSPAVPV
jgi:hypothetical protein